MVPYIFHQSIFLSVFHFPYRLSWTLSGDSESIFYSFSEPWLVSSAVERRQVTLLCTGTTLFRSLLFSFHLFVLLHNFLDFQ